MKITDPALHSSHSSNKNDNNKPKLSKTLHED